MVRARADYWASCEKEGLVLRAGLLGNIAKYNMFPCFDIIFAWLHTQSGYSCIIGFPFLASPWFELLMCCSGGL